MLRGLEPGLALPRVDTGRFGFGGTRSAKPGRAASLDALQADWRSWLKTHFADYASHPFAEHHEKHWEWLWSVERGARPPAMIDAWARGGAKSTTAEMSAVALGALGKRSYGLYVCHESGTLIKTQDQDDWSMVDEHPTAHFRQGDGFEVRLYGLPFSEVVTPDHRYWARTVNRKDVGHGRPPVHTVSDAGWVEAKDVTTSTWIGYPIDRSESAPEPIRYWSASHRKYVDRVPDEFRDPEWWWLFGLWWGDGTLGGPRKAQIGLAIGDADEGNLGRVRALLKRYGRTCGERRTESGGARTYVSFGHSALARWLGTWREGRNRKVPPSWVERLPRECQRALVHGYVDSDGHICDRAVTVTSIHYDGLLSLRRILMRLGIAGTIKRARRAGKAHFDNGSRGYDTAPAYVLRFSRNAESVGFSLPKYKDKYVHPAAYVEGDTLWSRVRKIDDAKDRTFVPITTATGDYLTHFGRSHNCSTQDQADDHVQNVGDMLVSRAIAGSYPGLAERQVGKYGTSSGWRRNRLRTAAKLGFTIDAAGLDKGFRGLKLEDKRPDFMIFDDIDAETDGPHLTDKKVAAITRKALPAGSRDLAVIFAQNLIVPDGVVSQLVDGRARFLRDRVVNGPVPAMRDLSYHEDPNGGVTITGGEPTWEGQDVKACEEFITTFGIDAFLAECQHRMDVLGSPAFRREWWEGTRNRWNPEANARVRAARLAFGRFAAFDTAETDDETSAYSVCVVGELDRDYRLRVVDVRRERLEFPELDEWAVSVLRPHAADLKLKGVWVEEASSGRQLLQVLHRSGPAWLRSVLLPATPTGKKEERWTQAALHMRRGCVLLPLAGTGEPSANWLPTLEEEMFAMRPRHQDQRDALSILVNELEAETGYLSAGWVGRRMQGHEAFAGAAL